MGGVVEKFVKASSITWRKLAFLPLALGGGRSQVVDDEGSVLLLLQCTMGGDLFCRCSCALQKRCKLFHLSVFKGVYMQFMKIWLYLFGMERRLCCSGSIYLVWRGGCVVWLYLFGLERRLCCSGSICLAWRGGHVALGSRCLAWGRGCVALTLFVWRGEEVVLSGFICLAWRGGCVALTLSVWDGEEVVLLWLYLFGMERRSCCSWF